MCYFLAYDCQDSIFAKNGEQCIPRTCARSTESQQRKNPDQACYLSGSSSLWDYEVSPYLVEPLQQRQLLGPMPRLHRSLNLSADLYDLTIRSRIQT